MYQTIFGTLHAFFISYESVNYLFNNRTDDNYIIALWCSYIYFMLDTIYLTRNLTRFNKKMLVHHSVPLVLYFIILVLGYTFRSNYLSVVAIQLLNEIPTLPLNICWILDKQNRTNTMLFAISGWLTLATYFIFRLIVNPCSIIYIMYDGLYGIGIALSPLICLNYYWFNKLVKKYNGEKVDKEL